MERALPLAMSERMELAVRLAICLLPLRCNAGMRFWVRWIECSLLILALANCYFAHDSSGFPVLLPFFDAPAPARNSVLTELVEFGQLAL
jgi:hypothetical protein